MPIDDLIIAAIVTRAGVLGRRRGLAGAPLRIDFAAGAPGVAVATVRTAPGRSGPRVGTGECR